MTLFLSTPATLGVVLLIMLVVLILVLVAISPPPSEGGRHKLGADADAAIEPDLDKRS